MTELTLLADLQCGGVPAGSIQVRWSPQPMPISAETAAFIEQRWTQYQAEARASGHALFDGPLARLISVEPAGGSIRLMLGPASFKTFVVAVLRDRKWFIEHAPDAVIGALGNSVLLTHGPKALLGIRSSRVIGYPGRAHLIGGGLEALETPRFEASAKGIVAHLLMEVKEELGLSGALFKTLCSPAAAGIPENLRLVCVARDEAMVKPELIWRWEVDRDIEELLPQSHDGEHAGWAIVPRDNVASDLWANMTPVAQHAWRCWNRHSGENAV